MLRLVCGMIGVPARELLALRTLEPPLTETRVARTFRAGAPQRCNRKYQARPHVVAPGADRARTKRPFFMELSFPREASLLHQMRCVGALLGCEVNSSFRIRVM